jgi:hypothetical protein
MNLGICLSSACKNLEHVGELFLICVACFSITLFVMDLVVGHKHGCQCVWCNVSKIQRQLREHEIEALGIKEMVKELV